MYDRDIVEAILVGDPAGFAAAYDRYGPALYAYCRSLLAVPEEAGNAVRDTFIIAIAKLPHLRDRDRLRPWLYAIARNECHRQLRERAAADILAETGQAAAEALDAAMGEYGGPRELVGAALAQLEPVVRDIAELSLRHELDDEGLAALLAVSRRQARALAANACQQFEAALGGLVSSGVDWSLCQDLGSLLAGWDGEMTVALRKRLTEHIKACGTCGVGQAEPPARPGLWPEPPAAPGLWGEPPVVPRPRVGPDAGSGGLRPYPGTPPGERRGDERAVSPGERRGAASPGERGGPRHSSRSRRGSGTRRGSNQGRAKPARAAAGSFDERPALPARRPPEALQAWPGAGDAWTRPRDMPPGLLPGSVWRPPIGLEADGDGGGSEKPSRIADHVGPFGKAGFPVPADPPRLYRGPVRSVLALAGVGVLAVVAVATLVTGTMPGRTWPRGPALALPASPHATSRHASVPAVPGQTPVGVVPIPTITHGSSRPSAATIRSSRSASPKPTVTPGILSAFPTPVTLQQSSRGDLPTGAFTLAANDGPVSFTVTVPADVAHELTVTPDSGSLPAGQGVRIVVTLQRHNGGPLDTHLNVQPGNLDVSVTYRPHSH